MLVPLVHSENRHCAHTCLLLSLSSRVKGSLTHLRRDPSCLGLLKHAKESMLNRVSRPIQCCQRHFSPAESKNCKHLIANHQCPSCDCAFQPVSQGERVAELILHHARANQCQDIECFKAEMAELVSKARGNTIALGKASAPCPSPTPALQCNLALQAETKGFFDQLLNSPCVFQLQVGNLLSSVFKLLMTHKVRSCPCLPLIAGSSCGEGELGT